MMQKYLLETNLPDTLNTDYRSVFTDEVKTAFLAFAHGEKNSSPKAEQDYVLAKFKKSREELPDEITVVPEYDINAYIKNGYNCIHVNSNTGADTNSGSEEHPLATIESAIKKGVETIVRYDVITVDTAIFKEVYCKKYLNYERLFNNLNKHTLSPKRNKKNSYNTVDSLKPLIKKLSEYLYNDCFNIHFAVVDALIENGVENVRCYIDNDSKQKSTALFNNYKDGFINKKDECKVIKQIIDLNPYRKDIYEYLIKEDGDILKDIENLTTYLGYDVSDYKDKLMNTYMEELIKTFKKILKARRELLLKKEDHG